MGNVKTVTYLKSADIKKQITIDNVKNSNLRIFILGYLCEDANKFFELDEVYYCLTVATDDYRLDLEVMESTSLKKVKQRQVALLNALDRYRGNSTFLVEYDESAFLYSDC